MTVTVARLSGDTDLSVQNGATLVFDSTDWDQPQTVTLEAIDDADMTDGVADFALSAAGWNSAAVTATEQDDDVPPVPVVTVDVLVTVDTTPPLSGTIDEATATIEVTVSGNTYTATIAHTQPTAPPAWFY